MIAYSPYDSYIFTYYFIGLINSIIKGVIIVPDKGKSKSGSTKNGDKKSKGSKNTKKK